MIDFVANLKKEVDKDVRRIENEEGSIIQKSLAAIKIFGAAHENLKDFIIQYDFKDLNEEIKFFKEIKPNIFKHLVYWRKIHNIEMNKPHTGNQSLIDYFENELECIQKYTTKRLDFYRYYRQGATHLDEYYFTRNQNILDQYLETFLYERDAKFSTNADFKVTKILANDMLQVYLMENISNLKNNNYILSDTNIPKTKLTWVLSKSDLIELIYALDEAEAFGKVTLLQIVEYFRNVFNIDLGNNISRSFNDMKIRDNNTAFIKRLLKLLQGRMDRTQKKRSIIK